MKWTIPFAIVLGSLFICSNGFSQEDDYYDEEPTSSRSGGFSGKIQGSEIGVDGYFGASTNGGSFTVGLKYGMKFSENFIAGPSIRYQRTWNTNFNTEQTSGFNVYGGGLFAHGRFFKALFVGAEFEMMRTPVNYALLTAQPSWVPCLFIGGGYSQEINNSWRINLGIMYDIINNLNSPFRSGYLLQNAQGARVPVIYRIAFFFPIS